MPLLTPEAAAELADSVRTEADRFRANLQWYVVFFAFIAVGFALVALFRLERELADLPLFLLAGAVHSISYIGLYLLIWVFVIAKLVYQSTHSQLEANWTRREALRRPGQSFSVAFWRFVLVAVPLAIVVFVALATLVVVVFFVLPLQIDALAEVLYAMLPGE